MAQVLAETTDIEIAKKAEREAPPGGTEIRFYIVEPIADSELQDIFDYLNQNGVDVNTVYQAKKGGLYYVGVAYNKPEHTESIAALPVAVIPLIGLGFIVTLVGFGILHVDDITKILLVVFGGLTILVALTRKPLEAVATRYMEAR